MVLHELATNAVKYGALSNNDGVVSVHWELVETDRSRRLRLVWRETGGPPVTPPTRKGFGSTLIERALQGDDGKVIVEYPPAGLVCTLDVDV
jgi:two-component sensor histidine kinase